MTCGRAGQALGIRGPNGAAASHSAELVRGNLMRWREGPLIRPFGPPSPRGEKGLRGAGWKPAVSLAAQVLALCLTLCAQSAIACPSEAEGFVRLATAEAEIAYRWEPKDIRVGQFFAAEVVACRAPGTEAVSRIVVDARMPAHGHGMNYRPKATQAGPGRFRFTGLMLHMAGAWQISFDLYQGDKRTRLSRELNLKP
jgi:hypothetical protein